MRRLHPCRANAVWERDRVCQGVNPCYRSKPKRSQNSSGGVTSERAERRGRAFSLRWMAGSRRTTITSSVSSASRDGPKVGSGTKMLCAYPLQCWNRSVLRLREIKIFFVFPFTGRTGTYAAIEMAYRDLIANDREVQMSTIFQRLRDQRAHAIQTDLQVPFKFEKLPCFTKNSFNFSVPFSPPCAHRHCFGKRPTEPGRQSGWRRRVHQRIRGTDQEEKRGAQRTGTEAQEKTWTRLVIDIYMYIY